MKINNSIKIDQTETIKARDLKLKETSKQLESTFLNFVFKAMEKTIPKTALTGGSDNSLSSMMFSSTMSDAIAEQGGIGLADQIYKSLVESNSVVEMKDISKNKMTDILLSTKMLGVGNWEKK